MAPIKEGGIESIEPDNQLLDDLGLWAMTIMWPIDSVFRDACTPGYSSDMHNGR